MVNTPDIFRPHCKAVYPPNNYLIFEEWFYEHYNKDVSNWEYLPIFWTSFLVNNNHAKKVDEVPGLHEYVQGLDRDRKYFTIVQYDLGTVVDLSHLDILIFNMSQNNGYPLPLICQPQPYVFLKEDRYVANFIGNLTHPIRRHIESIHDSGYYLSTLHHDIETYCRIISQSVFTLCFRGFGSNSFRIQEALQYGSIPVYISDEFIEPHHVDFSTYGVKIDAKDAHRIPEILAAIKPIEIIEKQDKLQKTFDMMYTYEANLNLILRHLKNEK